MSENIIYKEPAEEVLAQMQDYANLCSRALEFITRYEPNMATQNSTARLQESLSWMHTYLLNGGKLRVEEQAQQQLQMLVKGLLQDE